MPRPTTAAPGRVTRCLVPWRVNGLRSLWRVVWSWSSGLSHQASQSQTERPAVGARAAGPRNEHAGLPVTSRSRAARVPFRWRLTSAV